MDLRSLANLSNALGEGEADSSSDEEERRGVHCWEGPWAWKRLQWTSFGWIADRNVRWLERLGVINNKEDVMNGRRKVASPTYSTYALLPPRTISSSMPFSLMARLTATTIGLRDRSARADAKRASPMQSTATITVHCGEEHQIGRMHALIRESEAKSLDSLMHASAVTGEWRSLRPSCRR